MFSFEHIEYFLILALLPVLVLLFFYALRKKKQAANKIGDDRLVKLLTARYDPRKYNLKFYFLLVAFIAGTLALANFRSRDKGYGTVRSGIDVMIALDVSNSMLAQDISPSRLDRAKQVLGRIIEKLENDRVGIVVFAGKAYLQMPLTSDHGAAKLYLSSASPTMVPTQGTAIGEALKMCNLSFNENEEKYKAVILATDGEDHDEDAVSQAEKMAKQGVLIYSIGIGSPQGSVIPDPSTGQPKTDKEGNIVYSRLNESELQQIATKGNGDYQLYTSTDAVVSRVMNQLNNMDRHNIADESQYHHTSYYQLFLMLMLVLLVAEFLTSEKKRLMLKKVKTGVVTLSLLLTGFVSNAQDADDLIGQGNEAYKNQDYNRAAGAYQEAAKSDPGGTVANYNLGNALYKMNKVDESLAAYERVLKTSKNPMERSAVYYNMGVVYQNNKKLDECIEAYKNALRINPDDEDARQNLQKALRQKKQQEQQKQDNKSDSNKDQKPRQPKMSEKDAEQKLQALRQQEKNIHDKLKKANSSAVNQPEKDW